MMKDIGQKLKDAREKKGYSIQDVSVAIKINSKTLQAIEDGDVDLLPAKPFLRGFVQTYTKYLDMNVDDVMRVFTEELGTTKPKTQIDKVPMSETIETTDEAQKKFDLYKKIGFTTAALFAVILVYVIQHIVGKYEKEHQTAEIQKSALSTELTTLSTETKQTETATAESEIAQEAETQTQPQTIVETPAPAAPPLVLAPQTIAPTTLPEEQKAKTTSPVPTPTPAKDTPKTPIATTPALVTPPKPSEIKSTPVVTVTPVTPKPVEAALPKEAPKTLETPAVAQKKSPQNIIIEALDSVEVRFQKDGDSEKTIKLKPEQIISIQADYKVSISINDGGAVSVIKNGKDLGVPGSLGKPSKLSYP